MKRFIATILAVMMLLGLTACGNKIDTGMNSNTGIDNERFGADKELFVGDRGEEISVWDGTVADDFGGGSGSAANPFRINNAAQLAYLSECCKNGTTFLNQHFRLMCDINLNGLGWYPIGQYTYGGSDYINSRAFQGTFDGNNHFVSNFKIRVDAVRGKEPDPDLDVGLFGHVDSAYIHDLVVKDFNYDDNGQSAFVGGLVGRAWYDTNIENCHVINGFVRVKAADAQVGGLIGSIDARNSGRVSNCSADATVIVECSLSNARISHHGENGEAYYYSDLSFIVGGLIGKAHKVPIYNCFSSGSVSGSMVSDADKFNGDFVGGLIGYNSSAPVSTCYSTATVATYDTKDEGYIGGLIGLASGSVTASYSAGEIICTSPGFYCGGLVGGTYGHIRNCFSATDIQTDGEDMFCHTLLGVIEEKDVEISNCYISDEAIIESKDSCFKPRNVEAEQVGFSKFCDRSFLTGTLGFVPYDKAKNIVGQRFSGWILSDDSLPKLFFEKTVLGAKEEEDLQVKTISDYFDMTANELIEEWGNDYSSGYGYMHFDGGEVVFFLDEYAEKVNGNEKIVGVLFKGERDIGQGMKAAMTYTELKELFGEAIATPTLMEMDGTYVTSITIDNLIYGFTWGNQNYNEEECLAVSISRTR